MGGTYILTFPVKSLKTVFLLGHLCTLHLVLCFVGRFIKGVQKQPPPEVFLEILQNSQESSCASLFFNKAAGLEASTLLKRDSNTCISLRMLPNF